MNKLTTQVNEIRAVLASAESADDAWAALNDLLADYAALRAKLEQFAKWIVAHPQAVGDHACAQCYPFSDLLKDGFVCAYHAAELIARPRKEGE